MKATIKTYQCNAELFFDDKYYPINWDGYSFDTASEYDEFINEALEPISGADNYSDIKLQLEIATDHLKP